MSLLNLLNQTVAIQRKTETVSSVGDITVTWATFATVKGSVQAASSLENRFSQRETGEARYNAYLPLGTVVRTGDRFIVDGETDRPLYVSGPPTSAAGRGVYVFVPLTERQGGGIL